MSTTYYDTASGQKIARTYRTGPIPLPPEHKKQIRTLRLYEKTYQAILSTGETFQKFAETAIAERLERLSNT